MLAKDGGGSALLQAWCFPAPTMGPCTGRRMAASEPASGKGLEALALEVRAISGGLGARGQHQFQPLTLYVPRRRCGFMDAFHGRTSSGSSVSLPLLPVPLHQPTRLCWQGILWRPLSIVPVPATGGGHCIMQMNGMVDNLN